MADPPRSPDPQPGPPPRPRWVKVSAIIIAVLALLVVILAITGGHGPARHLPAGRQHGGPDPTPAAQPLGSQRP
jgi:hypothetical protein